MATKTAPKKKVPAKKVPEATFSAAKDAPKPKVGKKAAAKPTAKVKVAPKAKASTAKTKAPANGKTKVTKSTTKASGGQGLPRDLNEHGFVKGSDSEKIVEVLLAGGKDRLDINDKVLKAINKKTTRHGNPPNVSSLIANVLRRLKDNGYTIESSWVLLPPTPASKAAATRRAKAKGKTPAAVKPKQDKASTPAKKVPAKKTAKKVPAKRAK